MISLILNGINNGNDAWLLVLQILAMLIAITLAITAHEWSHGFAAYLNGDLTAKVYGRMSLNPLKHLDIMGFAALLLLGFGWAKPVPVDPNNFKKYKVGLFTVSIAGVTMNLILSIFSIGMLVALNAIVNTVGIANMGVYYVVGFSNTLFLYGSVINLTLMAFNLLPIYPLDGFRIVETFASYDNRYCAFMRRYGQYVLFGLLILGAVGGTISPYLDILGLYINAVTGSINNLILLMFGMG